MKIQFISKNLDYYRELYETPSIHPVGWIKVNSARFYDLVQKCAYVILPSCSDASAGSVVECMHAGLIPVITKEAGIDTEDFGVMIANESLEEIEKTVLELAEFPTAWLREHSIRTRDIAEKRFSENAFITRWREIVSQILNDRKECNRVSEIS